MTDRFVEGRLGRRAWLLGGLGLTTSLALGCASESLPTAGLGGRRASSAPLLPARTGPSLYGQITQPAGPSCVAAATTKDIEGPFFKAGAPEGSVLGRGMYGSRLALRGRVEGIDCGALSRASLEIWQADPSGRYDNDGFGFRTKVTTDQSGSFELLTLLPGHYKNGDQYRPAHVHVKVHHPDHPTLTTQLYFDGDPYNAIDPWFDSSRALKLTPEKDIHAAVFDFVLG